MGRDEPGGASRASEEQRVPMGTRQRARTKTDRFRWTPEQFQKAAEEGWFGDRKVELLDGDVYYMVRNPPHRHCVWNLDELFRKMLPAEQWTMAKEDDIEMGDAWIPSPDIAVLRGHRDLHKGELLEAADVALIVEVSHRTYTRDRGLKLTRYAHKKIPVYWGVHLGKRTVEVFSHPVGSGDLATYADPPLLLDEGEDVPVVIDGAEIGRIPVKEILP
jgi:Uma2 family endonuclease